MDRFELPSFACFLCILTEEAPPPRSSLPNKSTRDGEKSGEDKDTAHERWRVVGLPSLSNPIGQFWCAQASLPGALAVRASEVLGVVARSVGLARLAGQGSPPGAVM